MPDWPYSKSERIHNASSNLDDDDDDDETQSRRAGWENQGVSPTAVCIVGAEKSLDPLAISSQQDRPTVAYSCELRLSLELRGAPHQAFEGVPCLLEEGASPILTEQPCR